MDSQLVDTIINKKPWQGNIPNHVSVIAVKCYHQYAYPRGGVIASVSNGFVTDSFWRCSTVEEEDWFSVDYNDTSWETAVHVSVSADSRFPTSAEWIWATGAGYARRRSTTYCRGRISTCVFLHAGTFIAIAHILRFRLVFFNCALVCFVMLLIGNVLHYTRNMLTIKEEQIEYLFVNEKLLNVMTTLFG